ncbi:DNA-deoxyinosine glycosylase [Paucisalibacillus sp. EB02]|uniref:DNA-deoxyinosine glycosylase n=1 Tax=Paucisalibacillus sp. EB02 TaxID=1347087 RepID=UPI0005A7DA2E|nr:DNA-deoxyinosine glycosylase [Paucisalibacillus sp. EB02]
MTEKIVGLPPEVTKEAKVLILGSMPSALSLGYQEYYGNPRNHFWKIIYGLFGEDIPNSYEEKIGFVKQRGIALWDTIGTCYREGSLDSSIKGEEPNDIPSLLKEYLSIQLIACNGTKSFQTLTKYFSPVMLSNVSVIKLPSSSPIPGRFNKTYKEKLEIWKQILQYL